LDTSGITARPRRQRGFSIVEILLAMALSLILTLVVSQIYLGSKQTYLLQEAQSRLQENGRFALQILAKDIRRAGNMGCLSIKKTPVVLANPTPTITPATSIMGYNANSDIISYPVSDQTYSKTNWTPDAPDIGTAESGKLKAIAGTDIFTIQSAEPCGGQLQAQVLGMTGSPEVSIPSTNTCSIQAGSDELILSDCGQTEVFRADSVSPIKITGKTNNTLDHFTYTHGVDAEVMVFHSHTYFIRMFNGEPTLYRRENTEITPTPQPLIEGVENMQVLYGIDKDPTDGTADGSVDRYLSANNVPTPDWANVIAVRIDLVLRSTGEEGKYLTSTTTTACDGTAVTDQRLRRCYSFTVNLRNPRA